jgi:hypothetical protein
VVSVPAGLLGDNVPGLAALTSTLVQPYPVTVNAAPPAQEPGVARRPSGPVACTASPPPPSGSLRTVLDGLGRLLGGLPV